MRKVSMWRGGGWPGALWIAVWMVMVGGSMAEGAEVPPVSSICIEADSGLVLSESNADLPRPAASMVKMVLMLLVAEGLEEGRWTLETPVEASGDAAGMGGAQVYLKEGEVHPLGELMRAVAVASANDAAYAVAEGLWGSVERYLACANERALGLGMIDSKFHSPHGLPPDEGSEHDRTTARDMAILAQWCVRNPHVMDWVGRKEVQFRPEEAVKSSTNKLLWRMPDCDGLKTGFTRAAGFCVAATAKRGGIRLIAVVMGHESKYGRFNLAEELMDQGYRSVRRYQVLARGQAVDPAVPVANCAEESIRLVAGRDLWVTVRQEDQADVEVVARHPACLRAPLKEADVVGEAQVRVAGHVLGRVPLLAPKDLSEAGWRWKMERSAMRRY